MSEQGQPNTNGSTARYALAVLLMLLGCMVACLCCGGSIYGDYMGPPEGAAASNQAKLTSLLVCLGIGSILLVTGAMLIYSSCQKPTNNEDSEN